MRLVDGSTAHTADLWSLLRTNCGVFRCHSHTAISYSDAQRHIFMDLSGAFLKIRVCQTVNIGWKLLKAIVLWCPSVGHLRPPITFISAENMFVRCLALGIHPFQLL